MLTKVPQLLGGGAKSEPQTWTLSTLHSASPQSTLPILGPGPWLLLPKLPTLSPLQTWGSPAYKTVGAAGRGSKVGMVTAPTGSGQGPPCIRYLPPAQVLPTTQQ